jgi:hypothetical protein
VVFPTDEKARQAVPFILTLVYTHGGGKYNSLIKRKKTMNYSLVVASVLALAAAPSTLAFQTSSSAATAAPATTL